MFDCVAARIWKKRLAKGGDMKHSRWCSSFGLLLACLGCGQMTLGAQANFSSWSRQMQIRFAGYTKAETLTNFPVLVQFAEGSNAFHYADMGSPATGADLRFTDSAGTNELNYEIESWTNGGTSYVWVQVPSLADTNAGVCAWYGKTGQIAPACTTNGAAWNAGFCSVWHLNEPVIKNQSSGQHRDSTSNRWVASQNNNGWANGAVAGGQDFDGAQDLIMATNQPALSDGVTFEIWFNPRSSQPGYACFLQYCSAANWQWGFLVESCSADGNADIRLYGDLQWDWASPATLNLTPLVWQHVVYTWDKQTGEVVFYRNGARTVWLTGKTTTPSNIGAGSKLRLGVRGDNGSSYNGQMDEVRVSSVARSANWVWAEWMSTASNRVFCLYADAVRAPRRPTLIFQ